MSENSLRQFSEVAIETFNSAYHRREQIASFMADQYIMLVIVSSRSGIPVKLLLPIIYATPRVKNGIVFHTGEKHEAEEPLKFGPIDRIDCLIYCTFS